MPIVKKVQTAMIIPVKYIVSYIFATKTSNYSSFFTFLSAQKYKISLKVPNFINHFMLPLVYHSNEWYSKGYRNRA